MLGELCELLSVASMLLVVVGDVKIDKLVGGGEDVK